MQYNILPSPKIIEQTKGFFNVVGANIYLQNQLDARVISKAEELKEKLCKKTGLKHSLLKTQEANKGIYICKTADITPEGYILTVSEYGIKIEGGSDAGCFYGIVTLLQMLEIEGNALPFAVIKDWPDMAYRGYYYDATRGRVPSVEGAKKLIGRLAAYKINVLQFYVEHTFDFKEFKSVGRTADEFLSPNDILEIDRYCFENFIDFQPSLSTFGHLYELLRLEEYKQLCELVDYKDSMHFWSERMAHHTIDASNPESIKVVCSLIDQYLPLFRSEYFNICCDETFDLCRGRNKGRDVAETYIGFVEKIISHIKKCGKKVMMWGDIALKHPQMLSCIPKDTIILNWDYEANPDTEKIIKIRDLGLSQIVCPGTWSWHSFIEKPSVAIPNISTMAKSGFENGALGILNTNWGDWGHPAHPECALYGTLFGACVAWNIKTQANDTFDNALSASIYKSDINIVKLIKELEICHSTALWKSIFYWYYDRDTKHLGSDIKTVEESIKKAQNIADTLSQAKGEKEIMCCFKNSADAIVLLNNAALEIKKYGTISEDWHKKAEIWFAEYKNCWLLSSKPSEIMEIYDFLKKI